MDAAICCMHPRLRSTGTTSSGHFAVDDKTDHPISLYAATKKANELMAYSY